MQDQDARSRGVVQLRPGQLDLLQLAERLDPEVLDGFLVVGVFRVCGELTVHLPPGEILRSTEREDAVDKPEVDIEAQGTSFECREGVHVERYGVADDLVVECLAEADFTVKKHLFIGLALVPPKNGAVGHERRSASVHLCILVDQLDAGIKEALHLIAEPGAIAARTSAVILHTELSGIVTLIVLGRKGPHGFPFRRPHSHFPIH